MSEKVWRLIPALDCSLEEAVAIARAVGQHDFVYGFKVGFGLGLSHGLPTVVRALKEHTDKPVIYDHQKAATDIPATGGLFADTLAKAGIDEAILFPQAGPATLAAWAKALKERELEVIVGGVMTHEKYLVSEGGWLSDDVGSRIFAQALEAGVRRFVVPLTKPEAARDEIVRAGVGADCAFYSPGYGRQGGDASAFDFIGTHYIIVGRALRGAADPSAYADHMRNELEAL